MVFLHSDVRVNYEAFVSQKFRKLPRVTILYNENHTLTIKEHQNLCETTEQKYWNNKCRYKVYYTLINYKSGWMYISKDEKFPPVQWTIRYAKKQCQFMKLIRTLHW